MTEMSLYERLGGEDKIQAMATSIFDNHKGNKTVSARYKDREGAIKLFPFAL